MQFRRKAVTVQSVIWPAAILTAAALILMTVWTVLEGFQWVRTEVDPISGASFGKCKGEHTVAYFTPIFFLICIPVFFTAFMAYKTKVREITSHSLQNVDSVSFLPQPVESAGCRCRILRRFLDICTHSRSHPVPTYFYPAVTHIGTVIHKCSVCGAVYHLFRLLHVDAAIDHWSQSD